jgi:hypothetical protein
MYAYDLSLYKLHISGFCDLFVIAMKPKDK